MPCSREYYKDNTEICEELKAIVLSIDPTIPEADLVINEYSDNTDIVFWLCLLLGAIGDIIPEPADDLAVYFVDGNNPNEGTGAITNPYSTIDRVIERIKGEDGNPAPAGRVTVIVRGYEGANYAVTRNCWVDANFIFAQGAKVTAGATHEADALFDQISANVYTYAPEMYGQIQYTGTGKGLYHTGDQTQVIQSVINVQYQSSSVSGVKTFSMGYGTYPTYGTQVINFVGNVEGGRADVETTGTTGDVPTLYTKTGVGAQQQFTLNNTYIVDKTSNNTAGNSAVLDIGNAPFGKTDIVNCRLQMTTGGTNKSYYIRVQGSGDGLEISGLDVINNGVEDASVVHIETSGGVFSGFSMRDCYIKLFENQGTGDIGGNKLISRSASQSPNFTVLNIVSTVPFDGAIEDYIDTENSSLITIEGTTYIPNGKLRQVSAYTPVEDTDFVPKSYVDAKTEYVSFYGNISASGQLMSRINNNSYRWLSIEQDAEIESISLVVNGALNTTGAGNLTVIIKQIPLDGSLTATPSNTAGTTIATESFTLPDTGGADQYGVGVGANAVNVSVDGSVTPQGILIWTSALTANTIKHSEIIIKLKRN